MYNLFLSELATKLLFIYFYRYSLLINVTRFVSKDHIFEVE